MIMGQCAAINVIGQLGIETQQETIRSFSPVHLPPFPLMMALAVGGEATTLDMDGAIDSGRHIREGYFGNDLALTSRLVLFCLSLILMIFRNTRASRFVDPRGIE